ncbi:dihydroneopterin aldolase [Ehrlichia sp. JZT12]
MKIQISGLVVYCCIGLRHWERVLKQKIIIDCELTIQQTDGFIQDINDTIDYSVFVNELVGFINTNSFSLIETMASHLLAYIIKDKKICHCYLKLYKPFALGKNADISIIVESKKLRT